MKKKVDNGCDNEFCGLCAWKEAEKMLDKQSETGAVASDSDATQEMNVFKGEERCYCMTHQGGVKDKMACRIWSY